MHIRYEEEGDLAAVPAINESAFETSAEADLVSVLREQAEPLVSLVAENGGSVIGHIMLSPVAPPEHSGLKIMRLAPMAVVPEHQGRGVGSSLVRAGLETCKKIGFRAVVVLGHPEYYPRFGFSSASRYGIGYEYEVPDDALMLVELQPGFLEGVTGTVDYHETFDNV